MIAYLVYATFNELVHRCLKGNHEEMLLRFLERPETGPMWFANGRRETALSDGVDPENCYDMETLAYKLREAISPTHLRFLYSLSLSYRVNVYVFVHAVLRRGIPFAKMRPEDLIWIRDAFLHNEREDGLAVVHGHSQDIVPRLAPGRIGVDTGAYATGTLTAVVLEGQTRNMLSTTCQPKF